MNTLADYGDESDEESPRRRSFNMERSNGLGEVPAATISQANVEDSPKVRNTDSDHSPPLKRDSDAMFDDDMMFDEPRRYASFSDTSDRSESTEFREPPPPKRKEYHSPSPSLPTPSSKMHQKSDTDDENERLIDMALEEGRNALKQVEDGASTGSGGWTPRPYDSPLHGIELEADSKPMDTPPHQDVSIPPAPTTECDPELVQIFYKHFERKAAGIDVNISVQERKDFQNPSSYEQLILNFGINEVAEDQRKYMDSLNAAKHSSKHASGASKHAPGATKSAPGAAKSSVGASHSSAAVSKKKP
ncbi:HCNGP-like protein [Teladorsagia circumcincta]|uniref:HCNGP-like protein n=1 Tax=Teladorsagia circumcincta TaxID=45464 RepID=A0A2G9TT69_TELCI|nr:HCNGP-like protein [Teladorsagia circumcincta]